MKKVLIIGAGIAGLAAALRLSRAGWKCLVVERAPGRRSGGYMINLSGLGYDAAERLGILPELSNHDFGYVTSILMKPDGRPKLVVPEAIARAAVGDRVMSMFRGDLESVLYEAVRHEVELRFGVSPVQIVPDDAEVTVTLSDGTVERAALLIGADGLHSTVRALMVGPARVDMHYVVGAFALRAAPTEVPERTSVTFIGPGRTAAVVNLGPQRSSAFFTYRHSDPGAEVAKGPAAALGAVFGDLGGAVPGALEQASEAGQQGYFDRTSQIVLERWHWGRVVLLGDSAWCVTLFSGYGAALALAGADRLGTALEKHEAVGAALPEWEAGLRPETLKRQALAHRGARQYAPAGRAQILLTDLTMRAILLPGVRGLVRWGIERSLR